MRMELVVKCMVCGGREVLSLNPTAPDDMLSLAHRLLRECEKRHVLMVMTEEVANEVEE